jgi:hypothetical protein
MQNAQDRLQFVLTTSVLQAVEILHSVIGMAHVWLAVRIGNVKGMQANQNAWVQIVSSASKILNVQVQLLFARQRPIHACLAVPTLSAVLSKGLQFAHQVDV